MERRVGKGGRGRERRVGRERDHVTEGRGGERIERERG